MEGEQNRKRKTRFSWQNVKRRKNGKKNQVKYLNPLLKSFSSSIGFSWLNFWLTMETKTKSGCLSGSNGLFSWQKTEWATRAKVSFVNSDWAFIQWTSARDEHFGLFPNDFYQEVWETWFSFYKKSLFFFAFDWGEKVFNFRNIFFPPLILYPLSFH